jgi:Tfp pilus assembly protein PilF
MSESSGVEMRGNAGRSVSRIGTTLVAAAVAGLLAGCATSGSATATTSAFSAVPATATKRGRANAAATPGEKAAAALRAGRLDDARGTLATALRADPSNGYLHLLNGLAYQLGEDNPQQLQLATVGYDAAMRFAPGFYWSGYGAGAAALDRDDAIAATEHFAQAVLADPDRYEAFVGLAVASYYAGDLAVARLAAARAVALAPRDPYALRTAAFVAAASGDGRGMRDVLDRATAMPAARALLDDQQPRLQQLLRTAAVEREAPSGDPVAASAAGPGDQVMVEVTLLLSQNQRTRGTGINLLDGLQLQFGGQKTTRWESSPGVDQSSQLLTSALTVPQINYSLNLFNTREDFYEVIASPSLVATVGQTSDFFIGRTLTVGVSGVNLGSLQPIDVGTSVKVTPIEVTPKRARFRIETSRSFFATPASTSTFQQQLTTFKQSVGATVEVEFGRTLILSGLYEGVNIGASSKVPVLGDVPVVNTLFNARDRTSRQDAALVLVTPRLPGSIASGAPQFRGDALQRLLQLWQSFVEPTAGLESIVGVIEKKTKYFRPLAGDLRAPGVRDPQLRAALVDDTVARLR